MNDDPNNGRTLAGILADTREEIVQFVATRFALLSAEMREKTAIIKRAAPMLAVALVLLGTAYLLFTMAVVALVFALLPGNPFRWCVSFLAVALLWTMVGAPVAWIGARRVAVKALMTSRTAGVLKGDGAWIQSEVKNQI